MSHNLEYIKKQYISMFKRVEGNPSDLSSRLDNVEKRLNIIDSSPVSKVFPDLEQRNFQPVSNPAGTQQYLESKRVLDPDFYDCKNRKLTDRYDREVDLNSIPYYSCPGDDEMIAINRENNVSRLSTNELQEYPSKIPYGIFL